MLLFYILTLLISSSLLYTWFNSSLPGLIFSILKLLKIKSKDPAFWITPSDEILLGIKENPRDPLTWTESDFNEFALNKLPLFFGSLLTCRYCLCYHIVAWTAVFAYIGFLIQGINIPILFLLATIFSQPILVHLVYNLTDKIK